MALPPCRGKKGKGIGATSAVFRKGGTRPDHGEGGGGKGPVLLGSRALERVLGRKGVIVIREEDLFSQEDPVISGNLWWEEKSDQRTTREEKKKRGG